MLEIRYKTRFAPSPTGLMHVGNCRTALFNVLLAKKMQGHFLLRIEDTDRARSESRFVDALIADLHWLGLDWEEGPGLLSDKSYFQSDRNQIYEDYYQQLADRDLVYPCFCSEEKLKITRKLQLSAGQPPRYPGTCAHLSKEEREQKMAAGLSSALRFRVPENEYIEFTDLVRDVQKYKTNDLGDFIIKKADGSASFMFCNAIDDALMQVTHVLRGEDHLTNTPRQLLILQTLGLSAPQYGHISIILGKDGKPLSKRNGSKSVQELREEGLLPDAVVNYLARIGHKYVENHFMHLDELADAFSLENLVKSAAKYDENQLLFWQKEALMQLGVEKIQQWLKPYIQAVVPSEKENEFVLAIKANVVFPQDAEFWAKIMFNDELTMDDGAKMILQQSTTDFFQVCLDATDQCGIDWQSFLDFVKAKTDVKGKQLFQPIRVALTGQLHGPEMVNVLPLLGQDKMLNRFMKAKTIVDAAAVKN